MEEVMAQARQLELHLYLLPEEKLLAAEVS
jgi:hypothetical protein